MSDELEARMWDEESTKLELAPESAYFSPAFASSEHLDRAPLLSEETYSDVPVSASVDTDHCHWQQPIPPSSVPQLYLALGLCIVFMVCEVIGGYLAGSLSVMCDAAHMLSDCGGFALALVAFHCANRRPNATMSYGYKRAEVLGAMLSILLIWVLTGVFVYIAACRIHSGVYSVEPDIMMAVSGAGVAFNVVLAIVLYYCNISHRHSHGGSCSHTEAPRFTESNPHTASTAYNHAAYIAPYDVMETSAQPSHVENRSPKNINLRAALIHVIGDLTQSCGVLLASVLIKNKPEAKILDPICTFIFSFVVLLTTVGVVHDALAMLMQAVPKNFDYEKCHEALLSLEGVRHVHSLHAWALSTHHRVLTAHLAIDELTDPDIVLRGAMSLAKNKFYILSATFQIERYSVAMQRCVDCTEMDK